jgi:hypothetical protein
MEFDAYSGHILNDIGLASPGALNNLTQVAIATRHEAKRPGKRPNRKWQRMTFSRTKA